MNERILFAFAFIMCLAGHQTLADFGFQHYSVTDPAKLKELGLKCIPGRTVMKITAPPAPVSHNSDSSNESIDEDDGRRSHMTLPLDDDESCQICVCSTEGKDEYCSKRPAKNVNECIRIANLKAEEHSHPPFDHSKSLSLSIRNGKLVVESERSREWVCIPYASTYTDCATVENLCSGCNRCECNYIGQWECERIQQCPLDEEDVNGFSPDNSSQDITDGKSQDSDFKVVKSSKIRNVLNKAPVVGYIVAMNT